MKWIAGLLVVALGCGAAGAAVPDGVAIAPLEDALSFARISGPDGPSNSACSCGTFEIAATSNIMPARGWSACARRSLRRFGADQGRTQSSR